MTECGANLKAATLSTKMGQDLSIMMPKSESGLFAALLVGCTPGEHMRFLRADSLTYRLLLGIQLFD